MAVVKQHLPSKLFSPAAGIIQVLGCVGAMLSTPIARLVSEIGWRDTGVYAVFLAIILLGLFKFAVPEVVDNNPADSTQHKISIMKTLKQIISNSSFWHIGLLAMTSWAIIGGFAESWGVAFLAQLQDVPTSVAATQLLWMWVGVAVSSPLSGVWSENTEKKSLPLLTLYLSGTIAFTLVILALTTNYFIICLLLFVAGISAGGQIISFGLIADIAPKHILSTAVSFCNVCVIAGAFAIQPIVSFLLNIFWDGRMLNGKVVYTITQYQYSFVPIIIIMIAGSLASIKLPSKTTC
jgi:MFS family permease